MDGLSSPGGVKDKGKKTKDEKRKTKDQRRLGAVIVTLGLAMGSMVAPVYAATSDEGTGETKPDQPDRKDPTDIRNALDNMSLVREFAKIPKAHEKRPLADQLADQAYYTPMMRAQKQLFHGKYAEAEKGFDTLLHSPLSETDRTKATLGHLEAILAQGHQRDIMRFNSALATVPEAQRQTPAVLVLRAKALMQSGKLADANDLLRSYIQKNPALKPVNADVLTLFNLYGSILELNAQYPVAGDLYGKIVDLAKDELPEDPRIQTQYAIALHRFSVLTLQARRYNEDVKSRLQHVLDTDQTYWPAVLELAKLLLEAHNDKDGGEQIQATLELNPNCYEAKLILVKWATENYSFEQATAGLQDLREHSDSAEIPEAEGRLLLKQRLPDQAIAPLSEAVHKNSSLPEARGLLAGAYYLRSDSSRADEQLAAITAPQGGPHPEALFEAAEILRDARQFTRAEKLYLQAAKSASWWGEPFAALAQLYLETGQETKAKAAYDESFKIDPYNMRASNQLRLLDYLKQFQTVETPHFIIRYAAKADLADPNSTAKTQDRILAELAAEWLEKVYPEVCGYFQAYPEVKTQIELFPSHEEFGVRTTGLPWIGTVGACTGNVIAMDVPRGGAKNTMGAFDWARVMRHEFTHTVTLYMTDNRIPHWLTEAAACVQEQSPRDWEDCQLLAMNYRSGKLFKYQDLNWGFIRPKRSIDRMLAYRQSEWIYQYVVEVYGQPTMLKFLHCFKEGLTESQALQATFGKTPDTFNQDFLEWAGKQIASWGIPIDPLPSPGDAKKALDAHPDDPKLMYQLASAQIGSGKVTDDTVALLQHALEKDPKYSAAREMLGFVLHHQKKDAEARKMLEQVVREDPHRPVTLRTLGQMAMEGENFEAAEKWFLQLQQVRPLESTSYENLAGIYLIQHKYGLAIAQLTELQRHEQKDERIPRKLAELYRQNQQLDDAVQMAYKSIRINPYNPINHNLMGQILLQENQPGKAIEYFKYATDLAGGVPQFWAGLADAQGLSGDTKSAEESAKKAVELDPKSPVRKWIK
jgi:cellulose synthase operon protein C